MDYPENVLLPSHQVPIYAAFLQVSVYLSRANYMYRTPHYCQLFHQTTHAPCLGHMHSTAAMVHANYAYQHAEQAANAPIITNCYVKLWLTSTIKGEVSHHTKPCRWALFTNKKRTYICSCCRFGSYNCFAHRIIIVKHNGAKNTIEGSHTSRHPTSPLQQTHLDEISAQPHHSTDPTQTPHQSAPSERLARR